LYDGANLLEEFDGTANVLARYAQGPALDEPFAEVRSGVTSYYELDGLNSVISLSSSTGALSNIYGYDSYGKLVASTATIINPFQYGGREYDQETGLYYDRARYYDLSAGRFLSEDPTHLSGGDVNFYSYVGNSPLSFADPLGWARTPRTGPPNSTQWFPNPKDPDDVTVRVYGPNGEAVTDYDYGHDHTGAGDPHAHDWGKDANGKPVRGKPRPVRPGEKVPPKVCPMDNTPAPVPDYSCRPGERFDCVPQPRTHPWWLPLDPVIPEMPTVPVWEPVLVPVPI
jgi:RHS repeat-associated protein